LDIAWTYFEEYANSTANGSVTIICNKIHTLFPKSFMFPYNAIILQLLAAVNKVFPEMGAPADLVGAHAAFLGLGQDIAHVCMLSFPRQHGY
jgi:hypothetical protein